MLGFGCFLLATWPCIDDPFASAYSKAYKRKQKAMMFNSVTRIHKLQEKKVQKSTDTKALLLVQNDGRNHRV